MDEKQIREIAKMIFQMMEEKQMVTDRGASALPIAYVLLPHRWQEYGSGLINDMLEPLREKYQCVLVLPEADDKETLSQAVNCSIVTRDDAAEPAKASVSFFPIPCRDLVAKTALCLSDDFNSRWVRMCIEKGIPVYMKKETPMFTGSEPAVYQEKVLAYYQDAAAYGICFLEGNEGIKPSGSAGLQKKTGKYITMADLVNVESTKVFRMQESDTFTALAKEHIEELGVRVITDCYS